MFKELAPLLRQRPVVLMVNPLEGDTLRVIVMPKKLNDAENAALSTPLSITGSPEELDAQLSSTLTQFVGAHLELKNTLEIAKEEMAAAAKAARQDAKAKAAAKPGNTGTAQAKAPEKKQASAPVQPAEPKRPPAPMTANLFDFGAPAAPAPIPAPSTAPAQPAPAAFEPDDDSDEEEEVPGEVEGSEPEEDELDSAA